MAEEKGLVGIVKGMFKDKNPAELAEAVAKKNPKIAEQIAKPEYKKELLEQAGESTRNYRFIEGFAKVVDSLDAATSLADLASTYLPFLERAGLHIRVDERGQKTISALEKVAEILPKSLFLPYFAWKTGKIGSTLYLIGAEILSGILPRFLGELIDINNLYVQATARAEEEDVVKGYNRRTARLVAA